MCDKHTMRRDCDTRSARLADLEHRLVVLHKQMYSLSGDLLIVRHLLRGVRAV